MTIEASLPATPPTLAVSTPEERLASLFVVELGSVLYALGRMPNTELLQDQVTRLQDAALAWNDGEMQEAFDVLLGKTGAAGQAASVARSKALETPTPTPTPAKPL